MVEKPKHVNHIDLEIPKDELDIVLSAFSKMRAEPEDIDFSMMDLSPWEKFEALVEKMEQFKGQESPVIPMNFSEWVCYNSYVCHANDVELTEEEADFMDDLSMKNYRMSKQGLTPTGP